MITEHFWHGIENIDLENKWFQQDSTACHISIATLRDLPEKFRGRIISHWIICMVFCRAARQPLRTFVYINIPQARTEITPKTHRNNHRKLLPWWPFDKHHIWWTILNLYYIKQQYKKKCFIKSLKQPNEKHFYMTIVTSVFVRFRLLIKKKPCNWYFGLPIKNLREKKLTEL